MPKRLTPKTNLDTLRRDAKRRLKALRAGNTQTRDWLRSHYPGAGSEPSLRDVQHALARDYGFDGWAALKEELATRALDDLGHRERVDVVLHHVWDGDRAAAVRLASHYPEIAKDNLLTAIVFGDLDEVKRRLDEDPAAATRKGGPLDWEPILYLAYGRLPIQALTDNSPAIAEALLDAGADPNSFFDDGWGNPFKLVTGVIGLGEGVRPQHPRPVEMARLFIERGADPFDTQTLYNTSIVDDNTFWLDFLYGYCEQKGLTGRWSDANYGLGEKKKIRTLDYLLGNAVTFNHFRRAEWLLEHGANPNGANSYSGRPHHEEAQLAGFGEIARLLVRYGAEPVALKGQPEFQVAALRLDRDKARALAERHPAYLKHAAPMSHAIFAGRIDVVALLLDLGMDVNVADANGAHPLHIAAQANAADIGRLLIARGAEIDYVEPKYGATALGWANHLKRPDIMEVLVPVSRDVFPLSDLGRIGRLREMLAAEPARANAVHPFSGLTPLFFLPDDEDLAVEVAELLMTYGADRMFKNRQGVTPEQAARKRGLDDAADMIRDGG